MVEAGVSCVACGASAKDGGDVASTAGSGGVDGIDAIGSGVGDVKVARCIDRERGRGDECGAGSLAGNGGGCGSVAANLVAGAGFVHGVDEVAAGVGDVEDAIEFHAEPAGRTESA